MEAFISRRAGFDKLGQLYSPAAGVTFQYEKISGIDCYWITPEHANPSRIIIYAHGGAFAVGSIRSHGSMLSHFAEALQVKILFVDYALAPEHPYPQGVEDFINVYSRVCNDFADMRIDIAGESAGGGLLLSVLNQLVKRNVTLPDAAVLISPWTSLACAYPSQQLNDGKDIIATAYLKSSAREYIGEYHWEDADPESSVLPGFPAVFLAVGTDEILLDDSRQLLHKLQAAGNQAKLHLYADQKHNWPLANIHSEATRQLLQDVKQFLQT